MTQFQDTFNLPSGVKEKVKAFSPTFWIMLMSVRTTVEGEMAEVMKRCYDATKTHYDALTGIEQEVFDLVMNTYMNDFKTKSNAAETFAQSLKNGNDVSALHDLHRDEIDSRNEMSVLNQRSKELLREQRNKERLVEKAQKEFQKKMTKVTLSNGATEGTSSWMKRQTPFSDAQQALIKYNATRSAAIKARNLYLQENKSFQEKWTRKTEIRIKRLVKILDSFFLKLSLRGSAQTLGCPHQQSTPYMRIIKILENTDCRKMANNLAKNYLTSEYFPVMKDLCINDRFRIRNIRSCSYEPGTTQANDDRSVDDASILSEKPSDKIPLIATATIQEAANGAIQEANDVTAINGSSERSTSARNIDLTAKDSFIVSPRNNESGAQNNSGPGIITNQSARDLSELYVVVTEAFRRRTPDELNLNPGMKIKQKSCEGNGDRAFGWTRKTRFSKKKYGYYPIDHVRVYQK